MRAEYAACTGRRAILVALLLLTLTAVAGRVTAAPQPVCLALGDSIAAGLGSTLPSERGFAPQVCTLLGRYTGRPARLINLAVPGESTHSFLSGQQMERLRQEVSSLQGQQSEIALVMVSLGGNDLLALADKGQNDRQAGLTRFQQDYPAALAAVREVVGMHVPLVVTTVYDLTEGDPSAQGTDAWWVAQFNAVIQQAAQHQGAHVADLASAFRGHIREWTWYPVDVHPTNDGYAAIARLVWEAAGIDREPPTLVIERPRPGMVPRRYVTVRVQASDPSGVSEVEIVDGQTTTPLIQLPDGQTWAGLWPYPLGQASATLTVRAVDAAGHARETSVTVTLGPSTTPTPSPAATASSISTPSPGAGP